MNAPKFFAAAFVFLAAACGQKPPTPETPAEPAQQTARTIAQGGVVGFIGERGVMVWRGLPFAAAPVGDLRWRAPRPPSAWQGVREATRFAAACPQLTNVFNSEDGAKIGTLQGAEDCLYLNVYAPSAAEAQKNLPVMVWIHGGGNVWGSAKMYDPTNLVANENVIVVTVQYRMGPLGWFAHEMLRADAQSPEDASANFGTLDLIQSLKWVQENIAAFGGDPSTVTIFGESAGGQNVATLLVSPLAKGLFARAIAQSGLFDSMPLEAAETGSLGDADAVNAPVKVAARAGAASAAELRALSLEALYGALDLDATGYLNLPRVINDGIAIPTAGIRSALATAGGFNAVPVITGTNRDEMKLFQIVDSRLVNRWFGVIVTAKDQNFYDRLAYYQSRLWRIRSIDEPASAMTAAGAADIYAYRFDWDEGGNFLGTDLQKLLGAAHAIEIPFVFNRFQLLGRLDPIMFESKTETERQALSRSMGAYWAAFARTGAPGAAGGANWPRWSSDGALLRLDADAIEPMAGVDTMDALIRDLEADDSLDPAKKQIIGEALAMWLPARKSDFAAAAQ